MTPMTPEIALEILAGISALRAITTAALPPPGDDSLSVEWNEAGFPVAVWFFLRSTFSERGVPIAQGRLGIEVFAREPTSKARTGKTHAAARWIKMSANDDDFWDSADLEYAVSLVTTVIERALGRGFMPPMPPERP